MLCDRAKTCRKSIRGPEPILAQDVRIWMHMDLLIFSMASDVIIMKMSSPTKINKGFSIYISVPENWTQNVQEMVQGFPRIGLKVLVQFINHYSIIVWGIRRLGTIF